MDNIKEFIQSKGWEYRETDTEYNIKVCPLCKDAKWHFYINKTTGMFKCHKGTCDSGGTLLTLKKELGDLVNVRSFNDIIPKEVEKDFSEYVPFVEEAHNNLLQNKSVLKYLSSRSISIEAIKYFKLGYGSIKNLSYVSDKNWLWIPYFSNGKLRNVKVRTLPPDEREFIRLLGGESILLNEDVLYTKDHSYIIVCEGETDLLSLWSYYPQCVGVPNGAGGINPSWIMLLDKFEKIYIAYDNDVAGKKGAHKLANRLGIERCYNLDIMDYKDINDYLSNGNDPMTLLESARKFDVDNVSSLSDIIKSSILDKSTGEKDSGLVPPWRGLESLIGKFSAGDLIVLGARPGIGKTSFTLNLLYKFAKDNIPVLLFELEMRPERMIPRIVALHMQKPSSEVNNLDDLSKAYIDMRNYPFYFAYKYSRLDWEMVSDTVRMCVKRYGIRFLAFDNLHFLCRSSNDQVREVSVMIQNFKLLAEELAIPIMVIARPRKTGHKDVISGEELKDSADVEGDSDCIIILHREKTKWKEKNKEMSKGIFYPEMKVVIDKARWSSGGITFMTVHDDMCTIEDRNQ